MRIGVTTELAQERRRFWTGHLDRSYALLSEMMTYPVTDSGEPLVSIPAAARAAGVELWFSETKLAGRFERWFVLRAGLIEALLATAREMTARGWVLKIEEGYRTQAMQTALGRSPAVFDQIVAMCCFEQDDQPLSLGLVTKRLTCLVANYPAVGTHLSGAAVDVSVFRRDDRTEVARGAPYLTMSEVTPMASPFVSAEAQANRRAITQIMERHGFLHYPGEFWHYNQGDALYQILTKSRQPGRYGPVHWDAGRDRLTPYENPTAPLTSPAELQQLVAEALQRLEAA